MLSLAAELGADFVVRYGLGVLFIVFALEGALVGKLIPTRAILIASVLVVGTSLFELLPVATAAILGATAGQLLLFGLVRYAGMAYDSLATTGIKERHLRRAERWFDRWGLPAVAVSNILPVARGSMTIPAAASRQSTVGFSVVSLAGTAVYVGALVAVAEGIAIALPI
ncbi:DedA family protein [Halalkaliarchaeum desulfuricum]|nr:VTT domain-containing protein [Halalkaliarchaeum desulfuricum]